jgi:hypothetical protein
MTEDELADMVAEIIKREFAALADKLRAEIEAKIKAKFDEMRADFTERLFELRTPGFALDHKGLLFCDGHKVGDFRPLLVDVLGEVMPKTNGGGDGE